MKKLRFESLALLSILERKARRIEFHPKLTVINGANDVGKSSVIKSLYWALGAPPAKNHPKWISANVKALLTFSVDDQSFTICRDHDSFGVFDSKGAILLFTNQITRELGPFFSDLLNFKLVLNDRDGAPTTPPPAYAFLPFYVDQDGGWTKPLDSFANLFQFADFRKALLEFHTGILPNEYYELDAEKRKIQGTQRELEADRRVVRKAIERFNLQAAFDGLELSLDGHEEAVEALLQRLAGVRQLRSSRASKLSELLDQRTIVEQQVRVVRATISELEKDAKHAAVLEEEVFCPTCATVHQNDFAARFGIVEDRELCFEFLAEARQKIISMAEAAAAADAEVRDADKELAQIQDIIEAKRGDVSLQEVIESRGRRIASSMFEGQIDQISAEIAALLEKISDLNHRLNELKDKKRRDEIGSFYARHVVQYLNALDVSNYSATAITRIPAQIRETGSDLPRAILSFVLATLQTIYRYSTALYAPIVIDSPNQQDQDETNVAKMIDLIIDSRPSDAQVILGTVSLHGRQIDDGAVIEFTEKLSVLRPSDFERVSEEMRPYLRQMIG